MWNSKNIFYVKTKDFSVNKYIRFSNYMKRSPDMLLYMETNTSLNRKCMIFGNSVSKYRHDSDSKNWYKSKMQGISKKKHTKTGVKLLINRISAYTYTK